MMQPRRISRELVLLSISQVSSAANSMSETELQDLVVAATRTLTTEVRDALELAASELERGNSRLLSSETRATDLKSAAAMVSEAIELAQTAINRLGAAVDLPEFLQGAGQQDVHNYATHILKEILQNREEIDATLDRSMVDWTMNRLARVDQDILRIAVAEMCYMALPRQVAINEAVELAKRYSEKDGHRFINGVLRRVSDRLRSAT